MDAVGLYLDKTRWMRHYHGFVFLKNKINSLAATYEINLVDYPDVTIENVETDYVVPAKVE